MSTSVGTDVPRRLTGPGGRPLRLLHLTTVDMSLELLLGTELDVAARAGLAVHAASAPGEYVRAVTRRDLTFHPVPALSRRWAPRSDADATRELGALVRRLRPDIVHTHTPKAGVLGRAVARALRVPVVVNTCHGLWSRPGQRRPVAAAVTLAEGLAATMSHAELYQNAEDARRLHRFVRGRSEVVGNGVDLTRFRPDPRGRAGLRRQWGVADDDVVVCGVGRLVREKGVQDLAAAARSLPSRAKVVWVGPLDPDKPDALLDVPDGVTWLGAHDDMAAVYNACDVFVLPSYREGFSRSAMEAAACGLPLVLSDIRGCRELGTDGVHLRLVPPGDPDALASVLGALVDDTALRRRLGEAARERAVSAFDQVAVAARSLQTYAAVAAHRGLGWEVTG